MKKTKICVVGMGYVGLPLFENLSKYFETYAFDISKSKINDLLKILKYKKYKKKIFTEPKILEKVNFVIVTVPTPVYSNNTPDLRSLRDCCIAIGKNLNKKNKPTIIFESTVYPGATEEYCRKIIENVSKFKWKKDFFLGYSPERINVGDKKHQLSNINKIISGDNKSTLNKIEKIYKKIIKKKIIKVSSIKQAESSKIIENVQRDINIALMNEFSNVFYKLNLDFKEILEAANTKWNFVPFKPGFVGGHCIGVDPYYLMYACKKNNIKTDFITSGRSINNNMISRVYERAKKFKLITRNKKVLILGASFKENCNDTRNSKILEFAKLLRKNNVFFKIVDDICDRNEKKIKSLDILKLSQLTGKFDTIIGAVSHDLYQKKQKQICGKFLKNAGTFFDLSHNFDKNKLFHKYQKYISI
tara:strand:- start:5540 stop:6790 length:1251 start_codon:yes stop_codon:yes gene_type:complete